MKKRERFANILAYTSALFVLGFMFLAGPSQTHNFNLVLSIGSFLMMLSFVFHKGAMRSRGMIINLSGKPAEFVRIAMIIVLGSGSIFFLLIHFGII